MQMTPEDRKILRDAADISQRKKGRSSCHNLPPAPLRRGARPRSSKAGRVTAATNRARQWAMAMSQEITLLGVNGNPIGSLRCTFRKAQPHPR
jgi:hypothetical protein